MTCNVPVAEAINTEAVLPERVQDAASRSCCPEIGSDVTTSSFISALRVPAAPQAVNPRTLGPGAQRSLPLTTRTRRLDAGSEPPAIRAFPSSRTSVKKAAA